jgi:hypothetical protein
MPKVAARARAEWERWERAWRGQWSSAWESNAADGYPDAAELNAEAIPNDQERAQAETEWLQEQQSVPLEQPDLPEG